MLRNILMVMFCLLSLPLFASGKVSSKLLLGEGAQKSLDKYCISCHDSDVQKGNIRLDNLADLPLKGRLDLLNRIHEQVYSENMPPKKKKQPSEVERIKLIISVADELKKHDAVQLDDKLRYYQYGNYINHDKLFSGEIKDKPFTPARTWRINELIYHELLKSVFNHQESKKGLVSKISDGYAFYNVVKPFNLPTHSGVRYYANEEVDSGQFLTLLSNAEWVVKAQLKSALLQSEEFKKSYDYLNVREYGMKWGAKNTEEAFSKIILSRGAPNDNALQTAIKRQFQLALHRQPSAEEMHKYLEFTKEAVKVGGKDKGLIQMMVAVLMEPEFVNRSEKGDGTKDHFGRSKLTDREASYAIAYALTDSKPDLKLVEAVANKKLNTKADYEREVRRMLADDNIDKPRILRFFQDYFGYYNIFNVFKDQSRFIGSYGPHRVFSRRYIYRVPAKLAVEADLLVEHVLKKDKNVLKELLTTEKFFVHHSGNNDEMKKAVAKAVKLENLQRETYKFVLGHDIWKTYKSKPNKSNSGKVGRVIQSKIPRKVIKIRNASNAMRLWEIRFGKDGNKKIGTPIPPLSEYYTHAAEPHSNKVYGIDFRTWDYPVEQPFKVGNRMGLLTHPAWLISHSQNDHTDPVARGKWIQEKLLAGFIPDVPITVDANVPQDHHKTLRERYELTKSEECWGCHKKMNPLGMPLENFDDFGRYRTEEALEHKENILKTEMVVIAGLTSTDRKLAKHTYKSKPVVSDGYLKGTGDPALDGEVKDYRDLMARLAKSTRVRQSFVRHVFRYFMGRNEMLSDSQTLIEADKAYVASGGSFKELVVSLLTSDSFIYRKDIK